MRNLSECEKAAGTDQMPWGKKFGEDRGGGLRQNGEFVAARRKT